MPDTPHSSATSDEAARKAKAAAAHTADTAADSLNRTAETAKHAADTTADALNRTAKTAKQATQRGIEAGQQTLDAYTEAGRKVSTVVGEVSRVMSEGYSRQLTTFAELYQQSLTVRTSQDWIDVQTRAFQAAQDNLAVASEVCQVAVKGFAQTVQPLAKRVSETVARSRQAVDA